MDKKISIITVTYNCKDTIERTINSVITQDYEDYEYIVIDGASTDGTSQIIDQFRDGFAFYVSEPDSGIYEAMNKGLKHATGDWILFLNGDDYLVDSSSLSRMAQHYVDENTIVIGRVYHGDRLSPNNTHAAFKSKYYGIFYPHQATFVPRKLYDEIGGFDEKYRLSADFEWICRAIYKGYEIKWIDNIVSVYSPGGRSSSLQCVIDEYCISRKFMELTNDAFISDMTEKAIEAIKNNLFISICSEKKYATSCRNLLMDAGFDNGCNVQLWGAGFWGRHILELFSDCGIDVDCVFDSNGAGGYIGIVPVKEFEKEKAGMIVVATDIYDIEICVELEKCGFKRKENYWSFHEIRDLMLEAYDTNNPEYEELVERTGLHVLQKDS